MDPRRKPFSVGSLTAEPGTLATGYCKLRIDGELLALPVVIVHGQHPGPVLAVTAGIHGGEYVAMVAVRDFVFGLDPGTMKGTVVAALQSSPSSFRARSPFNNPMDGKNLNRSFPGSANGSATEQLADWLWANIIARADHYVDCHSGDLPEVLEPFAGVWHLDADAGAASLHLANQFDVSRVMRVKTEGSAVAAAAAAGIPSALIEVGGQGRWSPSEVAIQHEGLRRVTSVVGITDEHREARKDLPVFEMRTVTSANSGLWFPVVAPGTQIEAGTLLGVLEDPFGKVLEEPRSPVRGVLAYGLASLAANSGDLLASIATPALPIPATSKVEE